MSTQPSPPPALSALREAGAQLVRRSPATRMVLARLAGVVTPSMVPADARARTVARLEAAVAEACRPLAPDAVTDALRAAWGRGPERVLDDLDLEPLVVGPTAQVHRAVAEGQSVVAEVLRPGLEASVRNDLAVLETLAGPLGAAFPALDAGALVGAVRTMVLDELDLEHAGDNQQRVARALRRLPGLATPAVDAELTRPGVLVAAHVEGTTLAAGLAAGADASTTLGVDANLLARRLVAAYGGLPRTLGLVLVDPRADHVLQAPDGTTLLLGTGAAVRIDRDRLDGGLAALQALRDDDASAFAAALGELGLLPEEPARAAHALLRELLGPLLSGPARLDAATLAAFAERARGAVGELAALGVRATPVPDDLATARMLGQLFALLARLEVTEDWTALVLAAGREGPQALLDG